MSKAGAPFTLLLLAATVLAACTTALPPATDPSAPGSPVLVGTVVKVTDGDTIKVQLSSGPITVRFGYIDAPEHDQPWGAQATAALTRRLGGQQVELEVETQDRYERLVAVVYLRGENMNAWLVQQGHAWAYRAYLKEASYCVWESDARQARLGLWSAATSSTHAPWEWRRAAEGEARGFTDYSRETVANCVAAMPRAPRG